MKLNYTVALTCMSPPRRAVKYKVPKIDGVTWVYWRMDFATDGWLEYVVGGVLDQKQMDELIDSTGLHYECETGGTISPEGFKKTWTPALSFHEDAGSDYKAYITPFPAGLRNHDAYKFGKFEQHAAWVRRRYEQNFWERDPA